jgi:TolB-like protein/tetratricopeptide (TPR) repeat protein
MEPQETAPPGPERWRRPGRRSLWIGTGLFVGLVVAATVAASRRSVDEEARPRVAVAPFDNATGDSTLDPLGRMAADWITEGLIRTGLVEVVEPSPATAGVASVVEGRVYRTGDSIRVQARITEPGTGVVVRALEAAAADATRPTETLEPLRQRVVGALGTLYDPRLVAWAGGALRPPSFEAYQEFAAGIELHAVPRDLLAAAERFRRAAELDPDYALPRLWLAWTLMMLEDYAAADSVVVAVASRRQAMSPLERAWHDRIAALLVGDNERSYEAARRMVEIVPRSGWALALANAALDTNRPEGTVSTLLEVGMDNLGLEQEHGWSLLTAAYHQLGEYRRELAATDAAIRTIGLDWGFVGPGVPALAALGDVEALEHRVARLNVLAPTYGAPPGVAALRAGVAELRAHGFASEAESLADRMLDRVFPAAGATRDSVARLMRIETLYELGRWDEAEQALAMMFADSSGGFPVTALAGLLAARRGDPGSAGRIDAELAALDQPYLFGEPTFWRARIAAALGDRAAALRLLRQAFAEGSGGRAWYQLHILRDFDGLRDEPGFGDLVGRR